MNASETDREVPTTQPASQGATPSRPADQEPDATDDRFSDELNDSTMNATANGADNQDARTTDDMPRRDNHADDGDQNDDDIEARIRDRAYSIFSARRADESSPLEDWLTAEREIRFVRGPNSGSDDVAMNESLDEIPGDASA